MLWLEIIRLRSTRDCGADVLNAIEPLQDAPRTERALVDIKVYAHGQLGGDWAVHLLWQAGSEQPAPTPLGSTVAHRLRAHGMVDHSFWRKVS